MDGPSRTAPILVHAVQRLSRRLIFSYIVDWIVILGVAALGIGFSKIDGNKHAFSLDDPNISYPHKPKDTITFSQLIVVALVGPGLITFLLSMLLIPGPTATTQTPKALIWRRKLWEWNTAWMGLALALAGAFMFTEGLKDLAGKPRPDLLARCDPDLSTASLSRYQVGGLQKSLSEASLVVDWHICRNRDKFVVNDGFASWPSGHSSFSWAGMLYLSLWFCSKLSISIPFLAPSLCRRKELNTFNDDEWLGKSLDQASASSPATDDLAVPSRNQAAAPPLYLVVIALIPIAVALFVCVSRYADYRHAGFDIISGAVLGALFAYLGFRWYHMPLQRGAGWSWGARSRDRAFFAGMGRASYVGNEGWESTQFTHKPWPQDIENQEAMVNTSGPEDQR